MSSFINTALSLGFGLSAASLKSNPAYLADELNREVKNLARWLVKRNKDVPQSIALTSIVKAGGFDSWHGFHTLINHLDSALEDTVSEQTDARIERTAGLLVLLVHVEEGMPPTPELNTSLIDFASRIAINLNIPKDGILNALARKFNANSWDQFITRQPITSPLPLYKFDIAADGSGIFRSTKACYELTEELDNHFQGIQNESMPVQRKRIAEIRKLVRLRPDFIEGRFDLIYWDASNAANPAAIEKALASYKLLVDEVSEMIPAKFRGEIPWGYIENRWYHRLLFNYMQFCADTRNFKQAALLARRMLRQNKNDNLGVRTVLPSLLLAIGETDKVRIAAKRLDDNSPDSVLIRGLCLLANGDIRTANQDLLMALFNLPMLRPLLLQGVIPDYANDWQWHRGVIPDARQLCWNVGMIRRKRKDLFQHIEDLFNSSSVQRQESLLYDLYAGVRAAAETGSPNFEGLYKEWKSACVESAKRLALQICYV